MKSRSLLIFCLLLSTAASAAEPAAMTFFEGPGKTVISFAVTPEGKPVVAAKLNAEALTLYIDTGATTILDVAVARRLGLVLEESPEVATGLTGIAGQRWIARVNLQVGEMKITGYPVSCLDLSALRALGQKSGIPDLDGLIGSDLLTTLRAKIDYEAKKLTLRRPERLP